MEDMSLKTNEAKKKGEYKLLFKNTFYTYLNSYGSYIFSLATSFILARTISQELWGILILGISYIAIISNILYFFPPSIPSSLSHYIPRYYVQKEYDTLKTIVRNALTQRLIASVLFFLGSIIFFMFFINIFKLTLSEYANILFILAPLIIVQGLNQAYVGVNQGFNQFKIIFYLLLLKYSVYIGGLLIIIFSMNPVSIGAITFVYLMSELIPFFLNSINVYIRYVKIPAKPKKISFINTFKQLFNYGIFVSIGTWIDNTWNNIEYQAIGNFEAPRWVTGYTISINYFSVARFSLSSFRNPLIVSFSRLDLAKDHIQIKKMFNFILNYTSFFFMILTGIFYFAADFFLSFFYGSSYLSFSYMTKMLVIASAFTILLPQFNAFIQGTNKVKLIPQIRVFFLLSRVPLFLIGLIFFGINGMIYSIIIFNIINLAIIVYLSYKLFDLGLDLKKIVLQLLNFILSILLCEILNFVFLDNLNSIFLQFLNLSEIFGHLNVFSLIAYILIYLAINFLFRNFTREDLANIMTLFKKENKIEKLIVKISSYFGKFLRKTNR